MTSLLLPPVPQDVNRDHERAEQAADLRHQNVIVADPTHIALANDTRRAWLLARLTA